MTHGSPKGDKDSSKAVANKPAVTEKRAPKIAAAEQPAAPVLLNEVSFKREDCEVANEVKSSDRAVTQPQTKFGIGSLKNSGAGGEGNNNKGNFRDEWNRKRESDQKNTMVFNFVNSDKEVSHIENDGLDLSKRGAKSGKAHIRQLAKVRPPQINPCNKLHFSPR